MSDLQTIKQSVLEEARLEGQAIFQKAQLKQQQDYENTYQARMQEKKAFRKTVLDREVTQMVRIEQQVQNQRRQANLINRQSLIDQLFDGAVKQMSNWDQNQTSQFLSSVLEKFEGQEVVLSLNKATLTLIGESNLNQLVQSYPYINLDLARLVEKPGFVLSQGLVDYNYTYEALVHSMRETLSTQLSQEVFQA